MAYREWLSSSVVPPVWEGAKHPPTTLVDQDRYIWYIASTTAITPLNTALTLGYSRDTAVTPTPPDGVWAYSDQTILKEATSYNAYSHGAQNLKIGVADLKFTPTDTTLHPIIWRFGTTSTAAGTTISWDGAQAANGVVGDVLAYKWKDGVAPFTLKFVKLDGTVLSTQTTSNRSFTMNSTNLPAGDVYVDLYDSNGTFATTKTVLVSPSGTITASTGGKSEVQGIMSINSDVNVKNGSTVVMDGGLPVTAYGNATASAGSSVQVIPQYSLKVSVGTNVELDGRIGATYLQLSTDEVKPRYLQDHGEGVYSLYLLTSQRNIDFTISARAGEPTVQVGEIEAVDGDQIYVEKTGDNFFVLNPVEKGTALIQIDTENDEATTYLRVVTLDEYPDTVLIKNGADVNLNDHWITVNRKVLLNNNAHNINMSSSVVFNGDVEVSNALNVVVSKDFHIFLSGGSGVNVAGYKAMTHYQKIDNGTNVHVDGSVVWEGNIQNEHKVSVTLVDGHRVPTSGGSAVDMFGWKEEPHHEIIMNGSNTQVIPGQISVNQPMLTSRAGANVQVSGQKPADIVVGYRFVTSVFRGIQMEEDDVVIENPATITLTGVAVGGTMPDVAMPCLVFHQSMAEGREFVKGQITEIPEISLDSSIKLGVKLYSCDNTLLNPTTFASAYFTFDDELFLRANLDPVKSLIDVVASPNDLAILMRKKVYVMNVHVVDKDGNPSIVLTRKLRFI